MGIPRRLQRIKVFTEHIKTYQATLRPFSKLQKLQGQAQSVKSYQE